jgi:hypothetical protein
MPGNVSKISVYVLMHHQRTADTPVVRWSHLSVKNSVRLGAVSCEWIDCYLASG